MTDLRLVIFDVDGTLVDSQANILAAMQLAFDGQGLDMPPRETVLGQVGLSLDVIFLNLVPDSDADLHAALVQGYKDAFMDNRIKAGPTGGVQFYPGALDVVNTLHAQPETLLGIATGKSKRGLDKMLEGHGLSNLFVTQQVADFHPSKPHPAMLHQALADTGVARDKAVMIGDTSYDMEMAKAAGLFAIGVTWGYHRADQLTAADVVISHFHELHAVLDTFWG